MADTTFVDLQEPTINAAWLNDVNDTVYNLRTLGNYVNDAAAAAGGVAVGSFYRNGSVLMIRVV